MEIDGWIRKRFYVKHEFECQAGTVPDLQDTSSSRRRVIRPRKVGIYQTPYTEIVDHVVIEGQQVCRDGSLAGSRMILVGFTRWYNAAPPAWLNSMLDELGLTYLSEQTVPVP
jgi:hypothetical protein